MEHKKIIHKLLNLYKDEEITEEACVELIEMLYGCAGSCQVYEWMNTNQNISNDEFEKKSKTQTQWDKERICESHTTNKLESTWFANDKNSLMDSGIFNDNPPM